jgi:flagellar protein FliO/FliZ
MPVLLALQDVVSVPGPELVPPLGRTLGALGVVLVLLVGLAWLFKRGMLSRPKASGLQVETALPLGERRSLIVVTVEGRRLLLGLGPGHVSLVTELERPASFEAAVTRATGEGAA